MNVKNLYDDPSKIRSMINNNVPAEYKEMVEQAEKGIEYATELKKKKEEY